jgi:Fe-S cluster assembly iron-binding protein IscA
MLRITPEAGLAITTLAERQGAAANGGLRIETLSGGEGHRFRFSLSTTATTDELTHAVREETTGARVLMDPLTAEYLTDLVLDVEDTVEGTAQFRLMPAG